MIWLKFHSSRYGLIMSMCDKELVDKKIRVRENFFIDMSLHKGFYQGILINSFEEFQREIYGKKIYSINAFGKNSIDFLIKIQILKEENVIFYGEKKDVPHAQVYYIT
ncbi:MAG: DUF424 domain-containing protein [Candidatus Micrarchaeota archaeon]|nr:DUF424 domain-containing protein [Candidatus Micrarchaeota archaeon]